EPHAVIVFRKRLYRLARSVLHCFAFFLRRFSGSSVPSVRLVVALLIFCFFLSLGSPVAAFPTSPPASRAISASSRLLSTDRGCSASTSTFDANPSRCLINNQLLSARLPYPRVRTSAHEPRSFFPCRANLKSPFVNAASTSALSGVHVPLSHTITVPPPYSPSGITPSNPPYSTGWSSTCSASRFTAGSSDGPFGTAHDSSTPFHSSRKS